MPHGPLTCQVLDPVQAAQPTRKSADPLRALKETAQSMQVRRGARDEGGGRGSWRQLSTWFCGRGGEGREGGEARGKMLARVLTAYVLQVSLRLGSHCLSRLAPARLCLAVLMQLHAWLSNPPRRRPAELSVAA